MKLKTYTLIFSLFFGASSLSARAAHALDFSLFGIVTPSNYNVSPAPSSTSSSITFGLGGTVGFGLSPFFSLETGALFLPRTFTQTTAGFENTRSVSYMEIPVLLRISPMSLFSVNAGLYYGIPTASSVKVTTSGTTTSGTSPNPTDYGLLLGASVRIPVAPFLKIRGDLLYRIGLANMDLGSATISSRNFDLWAGLMLDVW